MKAAGPPPPSSELRNQKAAQILANAAGRVGMSGPVSLLVQAIEGSAEHRAQIEGVMRAPGPDDHKVAQIAELLKSRPLQGLKQGKGK